jgi:hypothetical protein
MQVLSSFQKEALKKIQDSYDLKKSLAFLIMPAGSGKTFLSTHIFRTMYEKNSLEHMAYVTVSKSVDYQFKKVLNESSLYISDKVRSYTFIDLIDLIKNNKINKNEFQFLIFDAIDEFTLINKNAQEELKFIFDYFSGFKLGFSRTKLGKNNPIFKNMDKNIIFEYTFNQAVYDGNFTTLQKGIYEDLLENFENQISGIDIGTNWSSSLRESFKKEIDFLKDENKKYQKAFNLFTSGKINIAEIQEISHRKEQLNEFRRLLDNEAYFDKKIKDENGLETIWQKFFELNPWIFGFGLNFIFNTPLDGKRLEQIVEGYSIKGQGKRTDALLKSTGLIQTLCFGEIKTHRKNILKSVKTPYRPESWAISDELAGGIAQVQRTVQKSLYNITTELSIYDENGFKQNNSIYLYKPKSFLIIGSLNEFKNEIGNIHEEKFSSFELFRRSITDIEIITFDELYERADAIINKRWNKQENN